MWVPSKSTQTGVTWGLPSAPTVARWANAFFWNRSLYVSGIPVMLRFSSLDLFHHRKGVAHRLGGQRPGDLLLRRPQVEDLLDAVLDSVEAVLGDRHRQCRELLVLLGQRAVGEDLLAQVLEGAEDLHRRLQHEPVDPSLLGLLVVKVSHGHLSVSRLTRRRGPRPCPGWPGAAAPGTGPPAQRPASGDRPATRAPTRSSPRRTPGLVTAPEALGAV